MSTVTGSDVVVVNVEVNDQTFTQANIETPLYAGFHTKWPELTRTYSFNDLTGLITDGFATTDTLYQMAQQGALQSRHGTTFKIGRLTANPTQTTTIKIKDATVGRILKISVRGPGVLTGATGTFTVSVAGDLNAAASGLNTNLGTIGATGGGFTVATDTVTWTSTVPGQIHEFYDYDTRYIDVKNTTPDSGSGGTISTSLTNLLAEDSDWYMLNLAHKSEAILNGAAPVIEAAKKTLVASSGDFDIRSSSTTDIASDLKGLTLHRSMIIYHQQDNQHLDACFAAKMLSYQPGEEVAAHKVFEGCSVSLVTTTEQTNITTKNASWYIQLLGRPDLMDGTMSSGRYFDIVRDLDYLSDQLAVEAHNVVRGGKIGFDQAGIEVIRAAAQGVLTNRGEAPRPNGGRILAEGSSSVDKLPIKTISTNDRKARHARTFVCRGTLQGSIQRVTFLLNVSIT